MNDHLDVPAVKEQDLSSILEKFSLLERLERGELGCVECGKVLTLKNIGALLVDQGSLVIYCDLVSCLEGAVRSERNA